MQGLILGAGQGRRLQPLTCMVAKPALRVLEKPLLWYIMESLVRSEVSCVFVTLYYKAQSILELGIDTQFDIPMNFLIEPELLGTGGGIRNAARFVNDAQLLVCNGDTLWDFNLKPVINEHIESGHDLTLVLTEIPEWQDYSAIRINEHGTVVRIGTLAEGPYRTSYLSPPYTFTGIWLIKKSLLERLPDARIFDFVRDFVAPLMMSGFRIQGSVVRGFWADMGTFERYLKGPLRFAEWLEGRFVEYVAGQSCSVAEGAKIVNSILWDHVTIAPYTSLKNCIAMDGVTLDTPVQIENTLLVPRTTLCAGLAEFNPSIVSRALAFQLEMLPIEERNAQ